MQQVKQTALVASDVTLNGNLAYVTGLTFNVVNGEKWFFEVLLIDTVTTGGTTGSGIDVGINAAGTNTCTMYCSVIGQQTSSTNTRQVVIMNDSAWSNGGNGYGQIATQNTFILMKGYISVGTTGTVRILAGNSASATFKIKANSYLIATRY